MANTETNRPGHQFRDAISSSARLLLEDKYPEALKVLDKAIAEAIRERQTLWIPTLCHVAANASYFMGDLQLRKDYYEQSLASAPENPRALYGLAKVAREQGQPEIARQYAVRCHKAISRLI
jgi:tetratricopeptide (TPR) repeat protein